MAAARSLADRFWSKVDVGSPGECWPWLAHRHERGYGIFSVGSRTDGSKRMVRAHRVAWELTHGPIPEGMHVLHRCDTPSCCNPGHLFLGDHAANMADMRAKGRARNQPRPGEANPLARLTDDQVRELRRRADAGESQRALAREFGVSRSLVGAIVRGQRWKHLR